MKPERPRQSWLPWETNAELEGRAGAYRAALERAYPGGGKAWQSRVPAPAPGSAEDQAHRKVVLAAGRAGVVLRELPGGYKLAHRIWWAVWFGEELEDEQEEVLPVGPPEVSP